MAPADALKLWRESREPKLSFTEAGSLVGVSGSAWFDWEAGKKIPSVDLAEDLERITDGSVTVAMWGEASRERRAEQKSERDRRRAASGGE